MPNPSRPAEVGRTLALPVDRLAHGGAGVARHEGRVVFVEGGLPGDRVRAVVTAARPRSLKARLLEVLEPSPARVAPACEYAARCGGCPWFAFDLARQRAERVGLLRDALERIGGLAVGGDVPLVTAEASGVAAGLGYRGRIEVALGEPADGAARAVGFRAAGGREVVDVERCAVASRPLNEALEALRRAAAAGLVPPPVAEVELARGDDPSRVVATARLARPLPPRGLERLADRLAAALPGVAGLRVEGPPSARGEPGDAAERGEARLVVSVPGPGGRPLPLEVPAGAFMQGNATVNARLVDAVVAAAAPGPGRRVLDVYCGAGNFALPLAAAGAEVLGLETDGRAVAAARRSAARLGLDRARFRQVDAAEGLRWAGGGLPRADAIVLDPPRAGAGPAVVEAVAALAPGRVLYVSCEPATLARDLARLTARGYDLSAVTAFDMFPQTPHLEALAVLARRP
jgi:23S rRNA (uracil1939-C5)-methyltransferase